MAKLRAHQAATRKMAATIAAHPDQGSTTVLEVVPGGGKSRCIPLLYDGMRKSQRRGVIWLAPRLSLQGQNAEAAAEGIDGQGARGLQVAPSLADWENSPSEFIHGLASNYCNLAVNLDRHIDAVKSMCRDGVAPLLVADELHHLKRDDGACLEPGWTRAFRLLEEALDEFTAGRTHKLLMTGTPFRGDGMEVHGLQYKSATSEFAEIAEQYPLSAITKLLGSDVLDRNFQANDGGTNQWFRYDRNDAIAEQAITRLRPFWFDFWVRGDTGEASLLSETVDLKVQRQAVRSALHWMNWQSVHVPVIEKAYQDLVCYRERHPGAQMVVVVDRQETAFGLSEWFKAGHEDCTIAVSDDARSKCNIDAFRRGQVNVLFTVAMAYEGMDAPRASHLVFLGRYRASSWLSQCFARVWRWGPRDWAGDRVASLYLPRDIRLEAAKAEIEACSLQPWSGVNALIDWSADRESSLREREANRDAVLTAMADEACQKREARIAKGIHLGGRGDDFIPSTAGLASWEQGADF